MYILFSMQTLRATDFEQLQSGRALMRVGVSRNNGQFRLVQTTLALSDGSGAGTVRGRGCCRSVPVAGAGLGYATVAAVEPTGKDARVRVVTRTSASARGRWARRCTTTAFRDHGRAQRAS